MIRRIAAAPGGTPNGDRLDLALHALAQLPNEVTLQIGTGGADPRPLELLARAYAIDDRVEFGAAPPKSRGARIVYTSARNAAAPRRYDDSELELIALDRRGTAGAPPHRTVGTMAELVEALSDPSDPPAALRTGDALLGGQRVVIVINRPTHYRVALLNRLARRLESAGASLLVLFTDDLAARPWMRPEPLAFDYVELERRRSAGPMPDLARHLREARGTILVAGGFSPAAGAMAYYADSREIPFGVWSGDIPSAPTAGRRLRRVQRRWITRRACFAIAYGYLAGEYLRSLAPGLPVVYGRNTTPFGPPPERAPNRSTVKVLAVSQAIPRKRLDLAIDAVRMLGDADCRLTIVGDGQSLVELRERASGHDNIELLGSVGSDRMLSIYRDSEVFLFPSALETFGLVLVEALGCGLATIVSPNPGAVGDLAASQRNCLIVGDSRAESWAAALQRLLEDGALRASLGTAGHRTIERRWTLDHAADAMVAGLRLAVRNRGTVRRRREGGRRTPAATARA